MEHPAKARSLIWVTDAGIIIVSSDEQFANASESIVSTPFSIVRVFRLIHLMYLQPIITQYFIDNKSEIWSLPLIVHSKG